MANPTTAPIRRWIVRITIGSFSVAALMGIFALLGGRQFGDFQNRVLLTTLLVGVVSIAVLCYLATAGRRCQPVGVTGGVVVLVPFVSALSIIWGTDFDASPKEFLAKSLGVGAVVAATLAQASVLLALGEGSGTTMRRVLAGTLAFAGSLAVLVSIPILGYEPKEDLYFRVLGVVAILDVLGTVVVAALVKFGPSTEKATAASGVAAPAHKTGPGPGGGTLPPDLVASMVTYAAAHQVSPNEVVERAVRELLDRESGAGSTRPRAEGELAR